jgi:hypothetical protein
MDWSFVSHDRTLEGEEEGKRLLGMPRYRLEHITKTDLREGERIEC